MAGCRISGDEVAAEGRPVIEPDVLPRAAPVVDPVVSLRRE